MPDLLEEGASAHHDLQDRGAGIPPQRLDALLQADDRAARAELRRQIARLEGELAQLFATTLPNRQIDWRVAPAGGPRLLGISELEQVRDRLLARIRDVHGILNDHSYAEETKRELLERMIAAPEAYKWVRVSNEDIGEPGCRHWHSRPRWGLLGMLMGWWRVKLSSGCPLAEGRGPAAPRSTPSRRWPSPESGASAAARAAPRRAGRPNRRSSSLARLGPGAGIPATSARRRPGARFR